MSWDSRLNSDMEGCPLIIAVYSDTTNWTCWTGCVRGYRRLYTNLHITHCGTYGVIVTGVHLETTAPPASKSERRQMLTLMENTNNQCPRGRWNVHQDLSGTCTHESLNQRFDTHPHGADALIASLETQRPPGGHIPKFNT